VDDEDMILSSLKNALKRMGYEVVALKDSQEAYEVFLKAPSGFDLVITDLTMPKLSGIELANKLMDIRPDIPVILCTGFNDVIDEDEAKSMGIRELLLKPASTNELKTAISRALENS
jgi:DNA-binding NtrC family response regulator